MMGEPIHHGPRTWWGFQFNWSQSWTVVEKFRLQQYEQSERAVDLGELPSSKWKLGDVIVFDWADGGNPHDHLSVVTRAGAVPRISQHSTDRRETKWSEEVTKNIPEYVKEIGGDVHGWSYEILRPRFRAANIPPRFR